MNKLLTIGTLAAAGVVGAGLLTIPGLALTGSADDAAAKREDGVAELVLVDDEDEDDTADRSRTRNSRNSRATGDNVNRVAQDRQSPAAGTARQVGTVRQQQAPRDNTGSNVTDDGPTNDTVPNDVSQDAGDTNDVSQDAGDASDESND